MLTPPSNCIFRRRLDKDSVYLCFDSDPSEPTITKGPNAWFTLRRHKDNPSEDVFAAAVVVPNDHEWVQCSKDIFAVGPEIVLVGGRFGYSTKVWIFDTRSSILRQAPSMPMVLQYRNAGLVGDKLYVFGTQFTSQDFRERYQVQAVTFNLKTQTWAAPFPTKMKQSLTTASVDKNIYLIKGDHPNNEYYNTRDGTYIPYKMPFRINPMTWQPTSVCVMSNVLYFYDTAYGLYWYDATMKKWKWVSGLEKVSDCQIGIDIGFIALKEYYGRLALLWTTGDNPYRSDTVKVWYTTISLQRTESELHGVVEPFQFLGTLPRHYCLAHCVSVLA